MKKLPPDFESDLRTIAERLYSNHAVVMVGAGFSRNASESYPDWNGLGDLFYSLLHPGESKPRGNYWNVMDLADEVAASKGRSELESIVQNRIGDETAVMLRELSMLQLFLGAKLKAYGTDDNMIQCQVLKELGISFDKTRAKE